MPAEARTPPTMLRVRFFFLPTMACARAREAFASPCERRGARATCSWHKVKPSRSHACGATGEADEALATPGGGEVGDDLEDAGREEPMDVGDDPDVSRNLELLAQLGMLGPASKKCTVSKGSGWCVDAIGSGCGESNSLRAAKKHKKKKKKRELVTPARVSSRLKGEDPQVDFGKPAPPQPMLRLTQERGAEPTSYRNVVSGTLETYTSAHMAALCSRDAYTPYVRPADAEKWRLDPALEPCQQCRLRSSQVRMEEVVEDPRAGAHAWPPRPTFQPMSTCSACRGPHGRLCGRCLWERYGENVTELKPKWRCPYCRGICNCSACRMQQGWGALGETVLEDAQLAGFQSVAHWIVSKRLNVDRTVDVDPNPVRKRGRPLGGGGEWLRVMRRVQKSLSFTHLPIVMSSGVVLDLGRVVWDRPGFRNQDYLYPVGYRVQRIQHIEGGGYFIMELQICDGGDKPEFRVFATDHPEVRRGLEGVFLATLTFPWQTVFSGPVSSTPIASLLQARAGRHRTISGPRLMYLDDLLVKAALHAQSLDTILGSPQLTYGYRYLVGEAFVIRSGDFVAVRTTSYPRYYLVRLLSRFFFSSHSRSQFLPLFLFVDLSSQARALHDAVVMRREQFTTALAVEWAECIDHAQRRYVLSVGRDDVAGLSLIFHLSPTQFAPVPGEPNVWALSAEVPNLTEIADDIADTWEIFN